MICCQGEKKLRGEKTFWRGTKVVGEEKILFREKETSLSITFCQRVEQNEPDKMMDRREVKRRSKNGRTFELLLKSCRKLIKKEDGKERKKEREKEWKKRGDLTTWIRWSINESVTVKINEWQSKHDDDLINNNVTILTLLSIPSKQVWIGFVSLINSPRLGLGQMEKSNNRVIKSTESVRGYPCIKRLNQLYCPSPGRGYPRLESFSLSLSLFLLSSFSLLSLRMFSLFLHIPFLSMKSWCKSPFCWISDYFCHISSDQHSIHLMNSVTCTKDLKLLKVQEHPSFILSCLPMNGFILIVMKMMNKMRFTWIELEEKQNKYFDEWSGKFSKWKRERKRKEERERGNRISCTKSRTMTDAYFLLFPFSPFSVIW